MPLVRTRAVCVLAIPVFEGQVDEAVGTDGKTAVDAGLHLAAIAFKGLTGVREEIPGVGLVLQDDIDNARNRIGTVLGRRAVTHDFDARNRSRRDGVQICAGGTAADRTIDMHQCTVVATFAVYQHQRLIRPQTTEGGRPHDIRAVTDGGC